MKRPGSGSDGEDNAFFRWRGEALLEALSEAPRGHFARHRRADHGAAGLEGDGLAVEVGGDADAAQRVARRGVFVSAF